jgi:3'' exoribonuclease family, domain 2.
MIEDNYSDADMPVAVKPLTNEVLLLQMDGSLTKEQFKVAMDIILDSGKKIHEIQAAAIKRPYQEIIERYER